MTEQEKCTRCGSPLASSVRGGLCPTCLLHRGLETNTIGFTDQDQAEAARRWTPPTVEQLAPLFPELDVLELVGRGGMGAVYKAREKQLDRLVALKVLPPEIGREPAFAQRFAREAQAMAKLGHPNIVTIYSFGQRGAAELAAGGNLYFFIMEYVDGLSLRQLLDAGTVSPKEALAIVPQICDALQYAHDRGIVHRDIKPENILLNRAGQVKIADFGLAKLIGGLAEAGVAAEKVVGTPEYMAPEQVEHPADVDHRADIYSLGVVFYQMLTGELPRGKFEPPSRKVLIDVRLDEVVLRAMQREPRRRYQQAGLVKTEVETILTTSGGRGDSGGAGGRPGVGPGPAPAGPGAARAHGIVRWTARVAGTGLLGLLAVFFFGQGMPSPAITDPLVLLEFGAVALWAAGFIAGWRREGWAAVLILIGSGVFHVVEDTLLLRGALELPTIVGLLYVAAWWLGTGAAQRADWRRKLACNVVYIAVALVAALGARAYVVEVFRVEAQAVRPEVSSGSRVLVYKLARTYGPGDIVLYRRDGRRMLGRVTQAGPADGKVLVERNGEAPRAVAVADIVGKVVVNTRSSRTASTAPALGSDSRVRAAEAMLELRKSELDRGRRMVEAGMVSSEERAKVEMEHQLAELKVEEERRLLAGDKAGAVQAVVQAAQCQLSYRKRILEATQARLSAGIANQQEFDEAQREHLLAEQMVALREAEAGGDGLEAARTRFRMEEVRLSFARRALDRLQEIHKAGGGVSEEGLAKARTDVIAAESAREQAVLDLRQTESGRPGRASSTAPAPE